MDSTPHGRARVAQGDEIKALRPELAQLAGTSEFHMAYQPIVHLGDPHTVVGFEALARFGGTPPDIVFARAEEVGLRQDLELLAMRAALEDFPLLPPSTYLSINLSPDMLLRVDAVASLHQVDMERLVIEITEHARLGSADYRLIYDPILRLRQRGTRLAVDDAGAGYSSMGHILQLLPNMIKLDRTVVAGLSHAPVRQALVASMVGFVRQVGSTLIAEGVEEQDELEWLETLGVTCCQGYLFARPMALPDLLLALDDEWTQMSNGATIALSRS